MEGGGLPAASHLSDTRGPSCKQCCCARVAENSAAQLKRGLFKIGKVGENKSIRLSLNELKQRINCLKKWEWEMGNENFEYKIFL
jgi:hypothetical protein